MPHADMRDTAICSYGQSVMVRRTRPGYNNQTYAARHSATRTRQATALGQAPMGVARRPALCGSHTNCPAIGLQHGPATPAALPGPARANRPARTSPARASRTSRTGRTAGPRTFTAMKNKDNSYRMRGFKTASPKAEAQHIGYCHAYSTFIDVAPSGRTGPRSL